MLSAEAPNEVMPPAVNPLAFADCVQGLQRKKRETLGGLNARKCWSCEMAVGVRVCV